MMQVARALLIWLVLGAGAVADRGDAGYEIGRRLYHAGVLVSGQPLHATVAGDAPVSGVQAACVSCHRRSGLGAVEGGRVVAPVTAAALFQPRQPAFPGAAATLTGSGRPAYTDATLRRAIRDGIDPAGRILSPLMPRYPLDDAALDSIVAYLKTLSAAPAPGVTTDQIHFATIVTDGVAPQSREALVDVLNGYFDDHNAEIRQQTRRGGRAVLGHSRVYRAWRRWTLHVWLLTGAPDSWAAQLEHHYRTRPVFAVVSGVGHGPWRPVHEFCERQALPCLFPNTRMPPPEGGFYSLYFSRGLELEAELLAQDLLAQPQRAGWRVLQLYPDSDAGRAAAEALRRALDGVPQLALTERYLDMGADVPAALRRALAEDATTDLVLWLPAGDLASIAASAPLPDSIATAYLSSSLLADPERDVPAALRPRARLVHPYDLPAAWRVRQARLTNWLRNHDLEPVDERLQANTYLAASLVGHTLEHLRENFSREYLIERLEHATENAPWTSIYPSLGLGSGQRFAAKGGYVMRWRTPHGAAEGGSWIVPQVREPRVPPG